jgi:hypothetical protein
MPRIRIVDEWIRCPASPPTRYRSIMVVAEQWAEQRVLMRAYAESPDQTRPTIVLHGVELAIGPAGIDPNGSWGIHVQPPVDGRAQEIAEQLTVAARRMAGSKGNPPRLADELSAFERKRTDNWSPGAPRAVPGSQVDASRYEPMVAASQGWPAAGESTPIVAPHGSYGAVGHAPAAAPAQAATYVPYGQPAQQAEVYAQGDVAPAVQPQQPSSASSSTMRRRRGWTSPVQAQRAPSPGGELGARTALGYASGAGAQSAVIRLGLRPGAASRLGRISDRTVPADFEITPHEREILNALGERDYLAAHEIGALLGVADPIGWMEQLMSKLTSYGLDIVAPGQSMRGEPTYVLAR